MPRPAVSSCMGLLVLLTLPPSPLTTISTAASQSPQSAAASSHEGFGGIWVLNKDLGETSPQSTTEGQEDRGRQGRRGGGRMGGGGRGGGFGRGRQGGDNDQDLERRQALMTYLRRTSEASKQLTIVVHSDSVNITDVDGGVLTLKTDDKKTDERAENGLVKFTRKNHWDGETLVSEIDVDNGPKIVRSFALSPGGTQLQITTSTSGGRGRASKFTRVYERPIAPQ